MYMYAMFNDHGLALLIKNSINKVSVGGRVAWGGALSIGCRVRFNFDSSYMCLDDLRRPSYN